MTSSYSALCACKHYTVGDGTYYMTDAAWLSQLVQYLLYFVHISTSPLQCNASYKSGAVSTPSSPGRLSTSCPVLDNWLKGGLLVPGVTEIAGTSAAGKTQICMQLSLSVQLPAEQGGLDGGV